MKVIGLLLVGLSAAWCADTAAGDSTAGDSAEDFGLACHVFKVAEAAEGEARNISQGIALYVTAAEGNLTVQDVQGDTTGLVCTQKCDAKKEAAALARSVATLVKRGIFGSKEAAEPEF
ncbi:hypothetical protein ERJ75_000345200 [Trypanosoma vivax]|nr:hypothetical protein ERJ75_000345200 [Trypanosoma vivax]